MRKSLDPLEKLDAAIALLDKAAQGNSDVEREELNRVLGLIKEARGGLDKRPDPNGEKRVVFLTRLLELIKVAVELFLRCKLLLQNCRAYIWKVWNERREKYQVNPLQSGLEPKKVG